MTAPSGPDDVLPDRTIWIDADEPAVVKVIDQRSLPAALEVAAIRTVEEMAVAILDMTVRGAGCIGVSAGYGMYLAAREVEHLKAEDAAVALRAAAARLRGTRPTAVNLDWAVGQQLSRLAGVTDGEKRTTTALDIANRIAEDDVARCRRIGEHGLPLITRIHDRTGKPVQILTHCNAGWLAFVQHGSATAPIYAAHRAGVPVHVWVGETRPRSQGALTAWELNQAGVPHTFVVDNAVGHLIQQGDVDMVITGADRVAANGDVANKIGTYLRALAADASNVPFYVAFPASTLDPETTSGGQIPIEERDAVEVTHVLGTTRDDERAAVQVTPTGTNATNPAFDITTARLVTAFITDRGVCAAETHAIAELLGTSAAQVGQ